MKPLATALAIMASPAVACDAYVAHVASYHTDRAAIVDVQEVNPGLGCRTGNIEIGAYLNSYDTPSLYAVYDTSHDGLSAFIGLASGYEQDVFAMRGGIMPVIGVAYHWDAVSIRVTPTYADETLGATFGLSFLIGE